MLLTLSIAPATVNTTFPRGDLAPNVHHTGDVWLYYVSRADSAFDYYVTQATSAPGSRLDWHFPPPGRLCLNGKPRQTWLPTEESLPQQLPSPSCCGGQTSVPYEQ